MPSPGLDTSLLAREQETARSIPQQPRFFGTDAGTGDLKSAQLSALTHPVLAVLDFAAITRLQQSERQLLLQFPIALDYVVSSVVFTESGPGKVDRVETQGDFLFHATLQAGPRARSLEQLPQLLDLQLRTQACLTTLSDERDPSRVHQAKLDFFRLLEERLRILDALQPAELDFENIQALQLRDAKPLPAVLREWDLDTRQQLASTSAELTRAMQPIIEAFRPQALRVASRFDGIFEPQDLAQEAWRGLSMAIRAFKPAGSLNDAESFAHFLEPFMHNHLLRESERHVQLVEFSAGQLRALAA